MTVRIEKDGWSITAETYEELTEGIRALRYALGEEGPPRKRLLRPRRKPAVSGAGVGPDDDPDGVGDDNEGSSGSGFSIDQLQTAVAMLEAIRDNGPQASTEPLLKATRVESPKGLGGTTAYVNRIIEDEGYGQEDVYSTTRTSKGRIWVAGSRINPLIQHLKRKIEQTRDSVL